MKTSVNLVIFILVHVIGEVLPMGFFVTPGLPAGYVSPSSSQAVSGLFHLCGQSAHPYYGSTYYIYCSERHTCCTTSSGYPACCVTRSTLNHAEITGVVVGCCVFVGILIGIAICISHTFCTKSQVN